MKSNRSIFTVAFFCLFFSYSIEIIELLGRSRWVEMAFYISGEKKKDTLWKAALKTDMCEKCFEAAERDISPPPRSQLQQLIHLVNCLVNVANSAHLCADRAVRRLSSRSETDRITYSRPLSFSGEKDQTSICRNADLGPFNCLSQTQWSRADFSPFEMERFHGTFSCEAF